MWHQDDPDFEKDLEDADSVICLVKHPNGKIYQVEVVDRTEDDGVILEVDIALVQARIFPERYLDSRYLKGMGYELFIVPKPNGYSH